ncbi:MAG: hypothetical protein IT440_13230, partial [Phycisphaeraceae bacterium]|nr:hypothetical protein [Phycisphaeraceae bacterium]
DQTIPHYLDYPLKSRKEWEEIFKPRLNPDDPRRVPDVDWPAIHARFAASGHPVCLFMDGYMGWLRNLMGFEEFAMLPYTDMDLFEEMVETLTQIKLACLDRIAGKIKLDYVQYWEDICYKNGPIVDPKAFRQVVCPRMKRVNDRLREEFGCKLISLDSDGDFRTLLDGWIESGVTVFMPCEVDANLDINELQQQYGSRCGFLGGIQKKALAEGKEAIRTELRRVLPAVKRGGYLPHLDHACPSNVPLDNYRYYIQMKREILGCA